MRSVLLCVMALVSCASALVAAPRVPLRPQQQLAQRTSGLHMSNPQIARVEIELEQGEPIEKALRRFRKATNNVGHLRLLRNRKTFESAHDKKIRKTKESAMRQARARRSARSRAAAGF